jgi:hypothetical protein
MGLSAVGLVYCAVKGLDSLRDLAGRRTPEKNSRESSANLSI